MKERGHIFIGPTLRGNEVRRVARVGRYDAKGSVAPPVDVSVMWYVARPGTQPFGPMPNDEVIREIAAGRIGPDCSLAQVGASRWCLVAAIPQFAAVLPARVLADLGDGAQRPQVNVEGLGSQPKTLWKFSQAVRSVFIALSCITILAFVLIVAFVPSAFAWLAVVVVPGLVSLLSLRAMLRVSADESFAQLTAHQRRRALDLAWGRNYGGMQTHLTEVVFLAYFAALPFAIGAVVSGGSLATVFWALYAAASSGVGCLYGFSIWPARQRARHLCEVAVDWVRRWYSPWLQAAGPAAEWRAAHAFQLDPTHVRMFSLLCPTMGRGPVRLPMRVNIDVLVVGPYFGVRNGSWMDVYSTSILQSGNEDLETLVAPVVCEDSTLVREREVHYRDIASVDYRRVVSSGLEKLGELEISIAGAEAIRFPTAENGVASAIEAVRQQTRVAKMPLGASSSS